MHQSNDTTNAQSNGDSHGSQHYVVPLIIGGKEVVGANDFDVRSPQGYSVWHAGGASKADAISAVDAAQTALPAWAKTKPSVRRDIFLKAADIFAQRLPELAQYQKQETGADDMFTEWILKLTVDNLKEVAGKCSAVLGSIPSSTEDGRGALVLKEPYGVILGIAPW